MNLKAPGLRWFHQRFGEPCGPVHVSKCYPPPESFTHHAAWWFMIPHNEFGGKERPDVFSFTS